MQREREPEKWTLMGPGFRNGQRGYVYSYYRWNWPSPIYRFLPVSELIWRGETR
jgi:hypothetical protein